MPKVSAAFFTFGIVCLLIGMAWGMHLGMTENFTLVPAHAHLNLLGFVVMAIYGAFYALTKETMSPKFAWANFWISAIGVVVLIPSLALFLLDPSVQTYAPGVGIGSLLVFIGVVVFGISVVRELTSQRT